MMKTLLFTGKIMLIITIMLGACIEPYDPPVEATDRSFLVVDGFLNASDGIATVRLTRTLPVKSTEPMPAVSSASVFVEDAQGAFHPLYEQGDGVYVGAVAGVNTANHYRLLIRTNDDREYQSDPVTIAETPAIDSITWAVKDDGVEIAVNTHDPTGVSRYFRWRYVETYEYNASFNSIFKFEGDEVVFRPLAESIFTCWKSLSSTNILINSTSHLQQSVVSKYPLTLIPPRSIKLGVKYSILVQQLSLTEEAYDYWLNLERSTEHLGGLFDPLPTGVVGNIRSANNPRETVIGYFSGSTVRESRMFLRRGELPKEMSGYTNFNPACIADSVFLGDLDDIFKESTLLVDGIYAAGAGLVGYTTTAVACADCRSLGGDILRPDFWE